MNSLRKNHFELFGLPERFALDATALDAAWRSVQGAVHPDRHAAATDAERRVAMQLATQANEAYRTLRDPAHRAAYLCELHGADPQAHSNTAMPPAFLMHQMEWRERLGEARVGRDAGAVAALRGEVTDVRAALLESCRAAIDVARDYARAAEAVRQLMFVERFEREIDDTEERLLAD